MGRQRLEAHAAETPRGQVHGEPLARPDVLALYFPGQQAPTVVCCQDRSLAKLLAQPQAAHLDGAIGVLLPLLPKLQKEELSSVAGDACWAARCRAGCRQVEQESSTCFAHVVAAGGQRRRQAARGWETADGCV